MKIAALQIASIPLSESKLDYYLRICASRDVKLLLFGEYVFNLFFKELATMPLSMLKEQSKQQIQTLKEMAVEHEMTIVAPIIAVEKKQPYKTVVKIDSQGRVRRYMQQVLIDYPHWNEAKYFGNPPEPLQAPLIFNAEGYKFAVMGGFELHFDLLWLEMLRKNVDCVLIPTVSTFDSMLRWREIVKTRAFTNNCYVLRANRIGEYHDTTTAWKFYGDSLFVNPDGEIEEALTDKEELLIATLDRQKIKESAQAWGFRKATMR